MVGGIRGSVRRALIGLATLTGGVAGQTAIPPDSVTTVVDSDTVPGMGAVGGVAVDALGYVYFADFRNSVWRYTPDGSVELYARGFYGASGNAIGPRGELYQSSFHGNFISRVERDGTVERWVEQGLSGPVGIAVGRGGELYVCNCSAGTIARVTPDRSVSTFASGELFACPNGITIDDHGDLYVVNFGNVDVVRITGDGTAMRFAQIPGAGGNGHIAFARGGFYVTKLRGHQVFRLERDGTSRPVAGNGTQAERDGPALSASMSQPNGIAASPGGTELWVNDLVTGSGVAGGAARSTLRRIRLVSLSDVLENTPPEEGLDGVRRAYQAFRRAKPSENVSAEAIAVGYRFLSGGRVPAGVTVLELNAADHPDDANSQFHLGEAYRYTGQRERAVEQYERVLVLDPDHPQAGARLALVRGS
jgi:sugar lactone lactonase YvrE